MAQIHQRSDATIYIVGDNGKSYLATNQEYTADSGLPAPALPQGVTERIYEPGVRHPFLIGNNVVDGGPMPWPDGDDILARIDYLLAQRAASKDISKPTLDMGGNIATIIGV